MTFRRMIRGAVAAAVALTGVSFSVAAPAALAEPCPDAEVIFARGTGEAPGVGGIGQAFVDSVRAQAGGRSVAVYPVNYPASGNFADRADIARSVAGGVRDENSRISQMAATCPDTRLILGGYSQGALVTGFATSTAAPAAVPAELIPPPLPTDAAEHVAAVVLFGKPSAQFLAMFDAPRVEVGPEFAAKTLDLCAPGDTICEGAFGGGPTVAHALYPFNGQVSQGAAYAIERL
ncbi:MAG: cutinase family protein [Mycobacterium sp.]